MLFVCCYDACGNERWLYFPSGALTYEELSLIHQKDFEIRQYGINTKDLDDTDSLGVRMDPLPQSRYHFLTRLRDELAEDRDPAFVLESSYNNVEWVKVADSIDMRTLQEYVVRNAYDGKTFWRIRETPDTIRWSYP